MGGYTKLFESILESTVWQEAPPIKVVWITMLAMADRDGVVEASIPGLAKRAGVEREECERALALFLAPDPDSRTTEHEGRRIEVVTGGWCLLNYNIYRERASKDEAARKNALRQQRYRNAALRQVTPVTQSNAIAPAPAEAEEGKKDVRVSSRPVHINGTLDDDVAERAGRFCERYAELYPLHRRGARYLPKPALDYVKACELVAVWDNPYLERLAVVFLKCEEPFAQSGSRTIGQFAAMASWCDGRLKEVEASV
jgi:hypothetical protein